MSKRLTVLLIALIASLFIPNLAKAVYVVHSGYGGLVAPQRDCHWITLIVTNEWTDDKGQAHVDPVWSGKVKVGPDCEGLSTSPTGGCPVVVIANEEFYTEPSSACLGNLMNDSTVYALYEDARDNILNGLGAQKSLGASNVANINTFTVYPNPTSEVLNFVVNLGNVWTAEIALYDVQGRKVYPRVFSTSNQTYRYSINVKDLPKGIYEVRLTSNNKVLARERISLQ